MIIKDRWILCYNTHLQASQRHISSSISNNNKNASVKVRECCHWAAHEMTHHFKGTENCTSVCDCNVCRIVWLQLKRWIAQSGAGQLSSHRECLSASSPEGGEEHARTRMHTNTQSKEWQFQFVLHSQEEDECSVCVTSVQDERTHWNAAHSLMYWGNYWTVLLNGHSSFLFHPSHCHIFNYKHWDKLVHPSARVCALLLLILWGCVFLQSPNEKNTNFWGSKCWH